MTDARLILNIASSKPLLVKALKIALVVGIILNFINQGNLIVNADVEHINFIKMALTFTVPFCVSMYTAITMKIKFSVGEKAASAAILTCKNCQHKIHIKQQQIIPFCNYCQDKTTWKVESLKG
jgi:hypothetical protein